MVCRRSLDRARCVEVACVVATWLVSLTVAPRSAELSPTVMIAGLSPLMVIVGGVGRSKAELCVTDFGRFGGVLGLG